MKGKLYGIGVGPGDSELMTVKAARIVGEADIIITPKTEKKDGSVALDIASPYIQEHTEIVPVVFPMVLDDSTQEEGWQEAKRVILSYLDEGKSVVFLTLGDPMFYSTYMYVYRLIENTGHEIETIPGVTAFCAIGSHLGYPIVEKEEVLAIVPATAPKEKIDAVLAVADDAVIMKVYKNFDEGGIEFSGGQAQKLAIARAVYKDAPIVILDEPTAALDPKAEYEIYSKFNELIGKKTTIYISHRLSSCRFCDNIAVFQKGKLIQYGTHDELVKDKGNEYETMYSAQAQYYI